MRKIHIGGNVENSIIIQGNQNSLNLGAPGLSAARQKELTERYLRSLAEDWQFLTVSVHGEDRHLPLERVFFMLQTRERAEPKPTEPPRPGLDLAEARLKDAGAPSASKPPPPPVPLEAVLGKGENLVLLGEPGAGKSTALQFIGLCFARAAENWHSERLKVNRTYIPIRLNLQTSAAAIAQSEALIDVLRAEVRGRLECSPAEAEALLEAWKGNPGLLVLLDGLDEAPVDLRTKVRERIKKFAHSGAGWVILTSRPAGFDSLSSGLKNEYTLKPFENPQTEALPYLRGWLTVLQPDWTAEQVEAQARQLLGEMQARPALRRLLDNPLLLRLSAQHYALSGEIARNRADLYRLWVEEAWQRATTRGAADQDKPRFLQALEALAWHLHTGGGSEEADLLQALQRFGLAQDETAAADLLRRLREQTGLLARLPQAEDGKVRIRYAFSHQTLREYFVALRLQKAWERDARRAWRFLKPRLHLPEWGEPLALLVGSLPEADALRLLHWILHARSQEENVLRRDLFLAAELAGESGYAGEMWKRLEPGLRRAFKDDDLLVHWQAAAMLQKIGLPTIPALIDLRRYERALNLSAEGWEFWKHSRGGTLFVLKQIGSPAIPALCETLQQDDKEMRLAAVDLLGKIGDPQAISALIQALKDKESDVRRMAAESLGKIGDPQAVPALCQILKDEEEWKVRWEVVKALGKIGDSQAIPVLIEILVTQEDLLRYDVIRALGKIGLPAVSPLTDVVKNKSYHDLIRVAAVEALGEIGDPQIIPFLTQVSREDEWMVRRAAVEALGRIVGSKAVDVRSETLEQDELSFVRQEVSEKHETISDRASIEEDEWWSRLVSVDTWQKAGDPQSVLNLIGALRDKHWAVREAAVNALKEIADPQAIQPLIECLDDENVRSAAVDALIKIGHPAIPNLRDALSTANERICLGVIDVLVGIGDLQAFDALGEAFKRDYSEVNRRARIEFWHKGISHKLRFFRSCQGHF